MRCLFLVGLQWADELDFVLTESHLSSYLKMFGLADWLMTGWQFFLIVFPLSSINIAVIFLHIISRGFRLNFIFVFSIIKINVIIILSAIIIVAIS